MTESKFHLLSKKKTTAVLGLLLVGSLGITSCSGGSKEDPEKNSNSSASTPVAPPVEKIDLKTEGAFDSDKAFTVDSSTQGEKLVTPIGEVTKNVEGNGKTKLVFASFLKETMSWELSVPDVKEGTLSTTMEKGVDPLRLLKWEDKFYVVAQQVAEVRSSASGLQAGSEKYVFNTYVVELETGKLANTVTSEKAIGSTQGTSPFIPLTRNAGQDTVKYPYISALLFNGVVNNNNVFRSLNPLTGEVLSESGTSSFGTGGVPIENYVSSFEGFVINKVVGSFGDFNLIRSGSTNTANIRHSLVNKVTGIKAGSMDCVPSNNGNVGKVVYSPDFRYLAFEGNLAFDTKTGKTFCGSKTETQSGFSIQAISNDGEMFGSNDSGNLLKVSLEDSKVVDLYETMNHDVPLLITAEGNGVFAKDSKYIMAPLTEK